MLLSELSAVLDAAALDDADPVAADPEITAVTHRGDWARPGSVYVAIRGDKADGHRFIDQAVAAGAVAVIGEGLPEGTACPVPYLVVPQARAALADAAAAIAGRPSAAMTVVGVTGTDGKTTTSSIIRHLARHAGRATGFLSTIGYERPDGVLRQPPSHFTTPEAPQVQQILAEIADAGGQVAVLESSSHALALDRVRAVEFDIAVWTNLTGEHLDFHKTMERYFADKAKLVERAPFAVLNLDDPWTDQLIGKAAEYTTYRAEEPDGNAAEGDSAAGDHAGQGQAADWRATDIVEGAHDLRFTLHSPLGRADAVLPMIGRFNVANALAALAAAARVGLELPELVAGLATFPGVAGRMEMVERQPQDPRVIVDFAHTPPSLEKALATVRVTTQGRLWVVIGSAGGPRDPSKRAPLGEVATRMADLTVFTEEDHRDTPLADILREMERGAREPGRDNFVSIGDRTEAIRYAIREAAPQDTVLLAGKGPEETLERDTETIPWDELSQAEIALHLRRQG